MSAIQNNAATEVNPSVEQNRTDNRQPLDEKVSQAEINKSNEAKAAAIKAATEAQELKADNISPKQLEAVAQQLQDFVGEMNRGLEFLVDKDSGRDVIKVIDKNNGDLIKQYPSEEVLKLVSKLSDATGALVNEKI